MHITPKQSKDAREILAVSQASVAKGAKISRTYLSQWENETKILTDGPLVRLRNYYEELGYEFLADGSETGDAPVVAPAAAPAVSAAPAGPVPPEGTYYLDGHVVPNGIRRGVADNLLADIQTGDEAIAGFLEDDLSVEPAEKGFLDEWFGDEEDDGSPVQAQLQVQRVKALVVVAWMARNYLRLVQLHGGTEFMDRLELVEGEDHDPEYLKTNAGAVAQILSQAPADFEQLNVTV